MQKFILFIIAASMGICAAAQEDHSEFIDGPFNSPQEVTETCLMCHEGIDQDIMKTRHWTWLGKEYTDKDGLKARRGKLNTINNFCVAVPSNWGRCTSCHIGFGWTDDSFDHSDPNNIDCLVCHDQTGTYKKTPTAAGMPDPSVDLVKVAQSVGRTTISNCAVCHFNGGGGTGVKHGDMDESMLRPTPDLDVHMGSLDFTCSTCHAGENHKIRGASHGSLASGQNHIACINCHDPRPHESKVLNNHFKSVACETCHIPTFARKEPTKTWWDWSTAGQDRAVKKDEFGMPLYDKKKGDFVWSKNVVPEYRWHNGQADYYGFGDLIDPSGQVELNVLTGSIDDPEAKITPFKVMRGKQIYDSKNDYLIVPKLFGDGGYWKTFSWDQAARLGMESVDLAYSGEYGFVETAMYWPINHMVAPAEDALKCTACHYKKDKGLLNWEALGYDGDPIRIGGRN